MTFEEWSERTRNTSKRDVWEAATQIERERITRIVQNHRHWDVTTWITIEHIVDQIQEGWDYGV